MQYLTRNDAGILVLNRDTASHFCPGCDEQAQNWFWNLLKISIPSKQTLENYCGMHIVFQLYQLQKVELDIVL